MTEELTRQEIERAVDELFKAGESERKEALTSLDSLHKFLKAINLFVIAGKIKEYFEDNIDNLIDKFKEFIETVLEVA